MTVTPSGSLAPRMQRLATRSLHHMLSGGIFSAKRGQHRHCGGSYKRVTGRRPGHRFKYRSSLDKVLCSVEIPCILRGDTKYEKQNGLSDNNAQHRVPAELDFRCSGTVAQLDLGGLLCWLVSVAGQNSPRYHKGTSTC